MADSNPYALGNAWPVDNDFGGYANNSPVRALIIFGITITVCAWLLRSSAIVSSLPALVCTAATNCFQLSTATPLTAAMRSPARDSGPAQLACLAAMRQ